MARVQLCCSPRNHKATGQSGVGRAGLTLQGCHTGPCDTFIHVPVTAASARLKVEVLPACLSCLVGFEQQREGNHGSG